LNSLLEAEPVDLGHISDEIRVHPELEELVIRLSGSLALAPGNSVSSIEEAVIVLGTDRLRVVVRMWSLPNESPGSAPQCNSQLNPGAGADNAPQGVAIGTPEMLYLASFLRCLGLDSLPMPIADAPESFFGLFPELSGILMRDFLSLIPMLDSLLSKQAQTGSGVISVSRAKEME